MTTFVGSGTATGNPTPGHATLELLNYGDFERGVTNPSPALAAAAYAFFLNGGNEAWLLLTADETVPTLTAAMDHWFGPAAPQRADLWTVPALGRFAGTDYDQVATSLVALATRTTGLALLEPPQAMVAAVAAADDVSPLLDFADHLRAVLPKVQWPRAAVYPTSFPNSNPGSAPPGTAVPVSAVVAGIMASTDITRGVWKSPAGTSATVAGIDAPPFQPTDAQMGQLNPAGLNPIVNLPGYGLVVWGARTLAGGSVLDSPWKYLAVRRLADFIAHSLEPSMRWAGFESNGPTLWANLVAQATVFLNGLYADGALAGQGEEDSYQITIDATTMTPADIAAGLITIDVYFAPVRPADFVLDPIQIDQTP